jgi:hypothetical protein
MFKRAKTTETSTDNSPLLFSSSAASLAASAPRSELIESDEFTDILQYITPETYVGVDLDDTVMELAQSLGGERWFDTQYTQLKAQYKDHPDGSNMAKADVVALCEIVQHHTKAAAVEEKIALIIAEIHQKSHHVIAITSRSKRFVNSTHRQLSGIGVDFNRGPLKDQSMPLAETSKALLNNGVIFDASPKGDSLEHYLAHLNKLKHKPKRIVYIDDKKEHVEHVKQAAERMGIEFIGIHYTRQALKKEAFHMPVAELQARIFDRGNGPLISDAEARAMLEIDRARSSPKSTI